MGVVFDKLGFMRKLEGEEGFTRPQAERLTDAFYNAVVESVATKQDLGDIRNELKDELALLRTDVKDLRSGLDVIKSELRAEIAQAKVWVVASIAAGVSIMVSLKVFG